MEPAGLVGLCFYDVGARSLYAKRPIRTIADIKGMTVRIQPSTMSAAMMHAVGAKVSTISHDRVPVSLEHGIIDAAESSWASYISSGDNQMARFFSPTEHTMAPEMLVFSKNVWDKLTKEEQTIMRVAAKESVALMRKAWDEREGSARAAVENSGSIWVDDVDRKSFSDAMFPVRARFLIEPKLQDMVNRILATH